ncbi:MAG TPA: hypothetical protein VLK25_00770 [Allosphingosinicella sp.]|nr:hypothetical protein [Allosphingosinicella sp.]
MILSRPISDAVRGVGRNALDLPVAAFAAVAVAFLAFAMPGDLLTNLVGASGLPSILPAAEPPLGYKARIGVGIIGALAVFGLVFLLLRLLDRTGYDAGAKVEPAAEPRARRRDAHPDAPAPRPISAAREFGEPSPPVAPPAPLWLEPEAPEAIAVPEPEPAPEPAPAPVEASASLPELMARLEEGLQRRRIGGGPGPSAPPPQVFPEAGDDRLQSAIDSLQRLAARQS